MLYSVSKFRASSFGPGPIHFLGWALPFSPGPASADSSLVVSPILGLPKAWHTQFLQRVQLIVCPISRLRRAIPVRFKTHTNGGKMLLRYIGETAAATASVKCFDLKRPPQHLTVP